MKGVHYSESLRFLLPIWDFLGGGVLIFMAGALPFTTDFHGGLSGLVLMM